MALEFGTGMEHTMLAETITRFVRAEGSFEQRARRLDPAHPARLEMWQSLADLGALVVLIAPERGGYGGTPADLAVVMAALAASLPLEPVLASAQICGRLLQQAAAPGAQSLLDGIAAGTSIPVLAHGEGHDPFAPPLLKAIRESDEFRLVGTKPAVRHADVATDVLVTAVFDGTTALFHIPVDTPGVTVATTRMIDGTGGGDVTFDATIGNDARLDFGLPMMDAVHDALEWGLVGLAVESAVLIEAVNAAAFAYLNIREQFGVRLASFQALQHKAADMQIAAEEAAAMAEYAVELLARPASTERSIAVLRASIAADKAGRVVAHQGVQLFGGMGVSDETAVSHFARRLAAIRTQIGTTDARLARLIDLEDAAL